MADPVKIKRVCAPATIGEGPYWEARHEALLYVDIPEGKIHRYFPSTDRHQELSIEKPKSGGDTVSFVLPAASDPTVLLIGLGRSLAAVKWSPDAADKSSAKAVALAFVDDGKETRFNDAKCDPQGRIWAGTMGFETEPGKPEPHLGSLYGFSTGAKPTACVEKVTISNGMAWSQDKKTFYYIDTTTLLVEAFDYDDTTGVIGNRRTVFDYAKQGLVPDLPDGMAIDVDGNLWVANFYGGKVICINPKTGKLVRCVFMPVQNLTSVCWGGPDYSTLFVTSSTMGLTEHQLKDTPDSGSVFEITGLGTKGLPPVAAVLDKNVHKKINSKFGKQ